MSPAGLGQMGHHRADQEHNRLQGLANHRTVIVSLFAGEEVVLSRALYYLALRRLDMTVLTIALTLSPVVTWLWSVPLFGGRPTAFEIGGGIAILAGVIVVSASRGGLIGRPR